MIQTVRGGVEPAAIGCTLMHEHVLNVTAEAARDQPTLAWHTDRAQVIADAARSLAAVKARGIDTIVDATAFGHGRDVATVAEINSLVDINIVVSTGLYTYDAVPFFFHWRPQGRSSADDALIDMFVRDIRDGIAGTGVRAGLIKCATDVAGVTPGIERALRAVARAHRETGVPITTHTHAASRNGLDQQRIFAEEGVDPTQVVIGHSGDTQDLDYLRALMDAGSTIGADRFGMYLPGEATFEQRVDTVARLCREGYADRIVLSHDVTLYTDWFPPGTFDVPRWVMTHVSDEVLPALRERGVTDEQLRLMLVTNPRRILEPVTAY